MAMALEVIQPHPTWDILDSSKLTCYMSCPRKYFYRYILGWTSDFPSNHLVFGSAWHIAMERLTDGLMTNEATIDACLAFMEHYREVFPPDTDEIYEPKTPKNAVVSIKDYAQRFRNEMDRFEILHTEVAGVVLVSEHRTMVFKCDQIRRELATGKVESVDYKTSQRRFSNWGDHWTLSTQMLTYLHALYCLYPQSPELRMLVRCAFFYKAKPTEFAEHPVDKSLPQMEAWLARTNSWIDRLDSDKDILLNEDSTDDVTMRSFPQNDTACFSYGRQCAYFDFCNAWPNPLDRVDQVQIGFKRDFWNPLEQPEIKEVVDLTQKESTNG